MLERDFSRKVKAFLDETGIYYFKKPQGRFVSRKGIADYILVIKGRHIAMELKTDTGSLTPAQVKERTLVCAIGEGVYFVARPETWADIKKSLVFILKWYGLVDDQFWATWKSNILNYD